VTPTTPEGDQPATPFSDDPVPATVAGVEIVLHPFRRPGIPMVALGHHDFGDHFRIAVEVRAQRFGLEPYGANDAPSRLYKRP
jgi:hypothetical protein